MECLDLGITARWALAALLLGLSLGAMLGGYVSANANERSENDHGTDSKDCSRCAACDCERR